MAREGFARMAQDASDEGESLEEREPGCFQSLPAMFVEYHTHKRVVIRSPWMQLPNVCAQVTIAMYIIFIQLLFNLRFMETESPDVTAVGQLQKPISNWDVCFDEDFDCMMDEADVQPAYCAPGENASFGPRGVRGLPAGQTQRTVEGCWRNDVHGDPATSFMIPTMTSFIDQSWTSGAVDWTNDDVTEYYMENIEAFHIRLFHSFIAPGVRLNASSDESQGFVSGTALGDQVQEMACSESEGYTCPPHVSSSDHPPCGSADVDGPTDDVCVSTQWGDVISVKTLLGAVLPADGTVANILDSPRPTLPDYTYRQGGYSVRIEISYENLENYWHDFFHVGFSSWEAPKPIYKIHVRPVMIANSRVISQTEILRVVNQSTGRVDPFRRTLRRNTGIWVMISTSGHVGRASIRQLLLSVTTALALLKLATMFVENLVVRLYWKLHGTFHVSILTEMHLYDRSTTCDTFKQNMDEEEMEFLHAQGKLNDADLVRLKHHELAGHEDYDHR